jgi:hypothetical protein
MAYEIRECRWCGERKAIGGPAPGAYFSAPDGCLSDPEPVHYVTCQRPNCQRQDYQHQAQQYQALRQRQIDQLFRHMIAREDQLFMLGNASPVLPGGLLGSGLLGADHRYRAHVPHTRLLMPSDEALIAELNEWQARDGWQPPRA